MNLERIAAAGLGPTAQGHPRVYRGSQLEEIAFPIGGIGTGSISLGGWGQLRDFELFNRPAKGLTFQYMFFALHAETASGERHAKLLQGPVGRSAYAADPFGDRAHRAGVGLPRFRSAEFRALFPFANVRLDDPSFPLEASVEGFNPFVPLDADASSLPVALFTIRLRNPGREAVKVALYASLENRIGHPEVGGGRVEPLACSGVCGLAMSTSRHAPDSPRHGTLALATPHRDVDVQTRWYRGAWFDGLQWYWDQVSAGSFEERLAPAYRESGTDIGSIRLRATVTPGESVELPVWIAWHNPNFEKYWGSWPIEYGTVGATWKNHYATRFADAPAVVEYLSRHVDRLTADSRAFAAALGGSTLPEPVLDAVSSQLSTLKSTTCLRLPDGTFYAWEGCGTDEGSCEGTCTHVWNYAQAMPYLFPALQRGVRAADYALNQQPDGHMTFRTPLPPGARAEPAFHAAADGQMGGIIQTWREWQISGDTVWLRQLWPSVRRALEFAWLHWDRDADGVMEGLQHNTYDVEFYGPNSMITSLYLAALSAAARMATAVGEEAFAAQCRTLLARGCTWVDAHLFNGEYYEQQVRPGAIELTSHSPATTFISGASVEPDSASDEPKYQYGSGCLSDQLIGQWYARMLDLGDLLDPEHVRSAAAAIVRYNWKHPLGDHANAQRVYALPDESGLILASWPRGGRPPHPFPYSDEVWTGIEYEVATLLIHEGFVEEGLAIVRGARDRYDGTRRNPWCEIECGNHYARAMSSYGLLLALSGFHYSAPEQRLTFRPRVAERDFAAFFSVEGAWGTLRHSGSPSVSRVAVELSRGTLTLRELRLPAGLERCVVTLGATRVDADLRAVDGGTRVVLADAAALTPSAPLVVSA